MNPGKRTAVIFALALLGGVALVVMTRAEAGNAPQAAGGAPLVVAYQGEIRVDGAPYSGDGHFKFAVVNAAGDTSYWSNDGSSTVGGEPSAAVPMAVSDGLFSVLLGDTTLGGMTEALAADVFSQPDRTLRVWFSTSGDSGTFNHLTPETRIAAVPYALQAQEAVDVDTVDGRHASELTAGYQNVVVVAKSDGDYTRVQAAIDSITDAAADNPYLVRVALGVYSETVTMKPYVHLQGAGQEATVITSAAASGDWPPTQATVVLASDASLRDLTVANNGTGARSVALLAAAGVTRTQVADVTARAQGSGVDNYAIFLTGSGVGVSLQQDTALAENGSNVNAGLHIWDGAGATVGGGSFIARGGSNAYGIYSAASDTTLTTDKVTALAENGNNNFGLSTLGAATLRYGTFSGRGGTLSYGIRNYDAMLEAKAAIALAENGSNLNYGLYNYMGAATLHGGAFTGKGGIDAWGIFSGVSGATLEAQSVTALGEDGSDENLGLENLNTGVATLRGGSFTARGGTDTRGISNGVSGATLDAESVTALGENGSNANIGLLNKDGGVATLRGGSFTARGGTYSNGINHANGDTTLVAESITALGENGSSVNNGLRSYSATSATLRGGSFTARGGTNARGIFILGTTAGLLEATGVTGLGEQGSGTNYGLLISNNSATTNISHSVLEGATNSVSRTGGVVTITNSRLAGGGVSGSVTCVLVTRGTTVSTDGFSCP